MAKFINQDSFHSLAMRLIAKGKPVIFIPDHYFRDNIPTELYNKATKKIEKRFKVDYIDDLLYGPYYIICKSLKEAREIMCFFNERKGFPYATLWYPAKLLHKEVLKYVMSKEYSNPVKNVNEYRCWDTNS